MNNRLNNANYGKKIKYGFIYLLIAFFPILVCCTIVDILGVPFWLCLLIGVVVGGITVFLCYVIHGKILDKKEKENAERYDPFRD